MHDLSRFTLKDMVICGATLRKLGEGATSLEEVADRVVQYFYTNLGEGQAGSPACALVRLFKTHPFKGLEPGLQEFVRRQLGRRPAWPDLKCFTLMATAGDRTEWNLRNQSRSFQAIPLVGEDFVPKFPMFSQLFAQLGVKLEVTRGTALDLLVDPQAKTFNVFHVPEALGSPYVPRQQDFVVPFGIRSVLGFGGLLPSGELFAVILFAKVPVPRETAELFEPLALCTKVALLPFDGGRIFRPKPAKKGRRA